MKRNLLILTLTAGLSACLIIASCTKDEGKLPVQTAPALPVSACDTITYAKHIIPIIDLNCATYCCHAGTTPNPLLTSYDQVKDRADAGKIKNRVIDANPSAMPPDGNTPLTTAQKDLITCWLNNGKKP